MPTIIPFIQSDNNYQLAVAIDGTPYVFDVKWNTRDEAFYFDLLESDGLTVIAAGIKVVLGVKLGRRCSDPFFDTHSLTAVDTSGQSLDAGYDDLGGRVQVVVTSFTQPTTTTS
jgi:hypothetical protein